MPDGPTNDRVAGTVDAAAGRVLLTGATGYVGGRLIREIEATGRPLRCMARNPARLQKRIAPGSEVVAGDVFDPESLSSALEGVDTAYYLIHSMGSDGSFEEEDRRAARNFATAARDAGVRRIIYLGGLGRGPELSSHLRSRQEVGRILRESGVPTIELRASIVIGSGSLSFEMIRALVERLPVMVTPRWVEIRAQPIAIEDLVAYLIEALDIEAFKSVVYEIGGAEAMSYGDLMCVYADLRGLRRVMIPVPVLTPHLSSLWLGLVTPVYARIGRKLVDGLRNPTVVTEPVPRGVFKTRPRGVAEAITRALENEDRRFAETRWSDALSSRGKERNWAGTRFGSRIFDTRTIDVEATPAQAFAPIRRIGGTTGWYYANWLWGIRGAIDLLFGGVGVRRGRRDPEFVSPGETVDFWRVEAIEPDRLLRLRAEMKLPGRAWLQFEVEPAADGRTTIRQTAAFDPVGLWGLAYWYALFPLHQLVFGGMIRRIGRAAKLESGSPGAPSPDSADATEAGLWTEQNGQPLETP